MTLGANFFILNFAGFRHQKYTDYGSFRGNGLFCFGLLCPERIYFFQINPNMISYLVVFHDRLFRNDYIEGPIDLMR